MKRIAMMAALTCVAVLAAGCAAGRPTLVEQGVQQLETGWVDKAERTFTLVLAKDPSDPAGLFYMGRICQTRGLHERAVYYYQCCYDADPGYPGVARRLMQAQAAAGVSGAGLRFRKVLVPE